MAPIHALLFPYKVFIATAASLVTSVKAVSWPREATPSSPQFRSLGPPGDLRRNYSLLENPQSSSLSDPLLPQFQTQLLPPLPTFCCSHPNTATTSCLWPCPCDRPGPLMQAALSIRNPSHLLCKLCSPFKMLLEDLLLLDAFLIFSGRANRRVFGAFSFLDIVLGFMVMFNSLIYMSPCPSICLLVCPSTYDF